MTHNSKNQPESSPEQMDYYRDLEKSWASSQPKFTDQNLIEWFGDAIDDMGDKIHELEAHQKLLCQTTKDLIQKTKEWSETGQELAKMVIKLEVISPLLETEAVLSRIKRLVRRRQPENPNNSRKTQISEQDIEDARQFPILQLAAGHFTQIRKKGSNYTILCPFHEEKTPSMVLFGISNTFHCFGCQAHGDSIALCQKLMGLNFTQSVKYLIGE